MQKIANPKKKFMLITDFLNNSAAEDLGKKFDNILFDTLVIIIGGSFISVIYFPLRYPKIQSIYVIQLHKLLIVMDLKINI